MILDILLVEDDEIETLKFHKAVNKLNFKHKIHNAKNGEEALDYCGRSFPNLVILDLNMPKMNGFELLKVMKSDDKLKSIPVIILTTSNNNSDLKRIYETGVSGYFVKPLRYSDYLIQIEKILNYWSINQYI